MPNVRLYMTDEGYEELRYRARNLTPRRTLNRYINFLARTHEPYLPPKEELPFDLSTLDYATMLRIVTQGASGYFGAPRPRPEDQTGEEDPRRLRLINLEDRTVLYWAATADVLRIPRRAQHPLVDDSTARCAWTLEFIARNWIRLRFKYGKEAISA